MKTRAVFTLSLLFFCIHPSYTASILDIGTQYRLRGISVSKADFGASSGQDYGFYSQRALAHVSGRFSPNIEMMTQFQAIGLAGSSATITNPFSTPAGNRYPNANFSPWVQWAYMKASQLYDLPVDLTIGRQPIMLGDGMILSDDDLGFTGLRLQSRLPLYGLQADAFTFKVQDSLIGSSDTDIYGFQISKPTRNIRYQLTWVMERDNSGTTLYARPSENISSGTLAGTDLRASHITRNFYDARIEGRLLEGGFYKGEFALQNGQVNRSSVTLGTVDLSGYAFLISAGLFTRFSKYGPIEIHGTFGMASGDSGDARKDSSFRPTHGRRFDGMERSGFGEFYGATLYDATSSSSALAANSTGLPPGFSGMRVIGAGVTAHPTSLVSVGIDYFVFNAMETAGLNFPASSTESSLGTELDAGIGFAYTSYLSFRGSVALFSPGKAYAYRDNATRFLVEAVGRF
ncbi:MAG: alginate export family protein [Elusimicrobiota bacterium]|jgi:hypothetical protein